MSKTLSGNEKRKRQAFLDEVRELERKHGYRLAYYQYPVQVTVKPLIPEVSKEAAELAAQIAGTARAKKSLFAYLKHLWPKSSNAADADPAPAESPAAPNKPTSAP